VPEAHPFISYHLDKQQQEKWNNIIDYIQTMTGKTINLI
jgi:hypothetical protein